MHRASPLPHLFLLALITGCESAPVVEEVVLTNASESLEAVLEHGELVGACDRYWAHEAEGSATRRELLLCGKEMFFYEDFETPGLPTALLRFYMEALPETVGPGMRGFGMHRDPYAADGRPLGFGDALSIGNARDVPTVAFTCASCQFGRAPDGRYVVGLGNREYDYGAQLVAISRFPVLNGNDLSMESPEVRRIVEPMVEEWNARSADDQRALFADLAAGLGSGLTVDPSTRMSDAQALAHASWGPGRLDALMFPNPVDDHVHAPTKIPNAFGLPTPEEMAAASPTGDPHLRIGWAGSAPSIEEFARGFIALGEGDPSGWIPARVAPLRAYLESLEPPTSPHREDEALIAEGRQLFDERGCAECHNAPGYASTAVYSFEEIGTDAALASILDASGSGVPTPNLTPDHPSLLTRGVKAPRLYGMWATTRFLHNGSVSSLEALFCLESERPTIEAEPWSDGGHRETCDGLEDEEKRALIAFLRSL